MKEVCTGRLTNTGHSIAKKMGMAISDYDMINSGDRILVGVSGGKDSLSLIVLLQERKKWVPIDYDVVGMYVRTEHSCSGCVHADSIDDFLGRFGIDLHMVDINLSELSNRDKQEMNCFWCSWNRRKVMFDYAGKKGFNKIALGHHKDDIIETILMNILFQGEISAMSPKVSLFNGELDLIRPMAYVMEGATKRLSEEMKFPKNICKCPYGMDSKRKVIKNIINDLERICPSVKHNIFNSLKNIRKEYLV